MGANKSNFVPNFSQCSPSMFLPGKVCRELLRKAWNCKMNKLAGNLWVSLKLYWGYSRLEIAQKVWRNWELPRTPFTENSIYQELLAKPKWGDLRSLFGTWVTSSCSYEPPVMNHNQREMCINDPNYDRWSRRLLEEAFCQKTSFRKILSEDLFQPSPEDPSASGPCQWFHSTYELWARSKRIHSVRWEIKREICSVKFVCFSNDSSWLFANGKFAPKSHKKRSQPFKGQQVRGH